MPCRTCSPASAPSSRPTATTASLRPIPRAASAAPTRSPTLVSAKVVPGSRGSPTLPSMLRISAVDSANEGTLRPGDVVLAIDGIVGPRMTEVVGEVRFVNQLYINGRVHGNVLKNIVNGCRMRFTAVIAT